MLALAALPPLGPLVAFALSHPWPQLAGPVVAGTMMVGACVFGAVWGVGKWLEGKGK